MSALSSSISPSAIASQVKSIIAGPETNLGKLLGAVTSLPGVLSDTKASVVQVTKKAAANAARKEVNSRLGNGSQPATDNSGYNESYDNSGYNESYDNSGYNESYDNSGEQYGGRRKTKRRRTRQKKRKNKSKNTRRRRSRVKKLA
jgi:hypothetical protein